MHMHIHTHMHTYIHTYIYTYIHTYIHTYTHTHVCIHIHTYIHGITHTYAHTYTELLCFISVYLLCDESKGRIKREVSACDCIQHQELPFAAIRAQLDEGWDSRCPGPSQNMKVKVCNLCNYINIYQYRSPGIYFL